MRELTGRDAVDTDAILGPLSSQGLAELDNTSLGCVVARLLLWVVDDRAGHRSNQDDGSRLVLGHQGTTNSLGHHEGTGQVDIDQAAPHLEIVGLGWDVGTVKLLVEVQRFADLPS